MRRILLYATPYVRLYLFSLLVSFVATALGMATPLFMAILIDNVFGAKRPDLLLPVAGAFFAVMVLSVAAGFFRSYLYALIGEKVSRDIRTELAARSLTLPLGYYEREKTGAVMARFTADVPAVQGLFTTLVDAVAQCITLLTALGLMYYLAPELLLVALPFVPVLVVGVLIVGPRVKKASRRVQDAAAGMSADLQEEISGVRVTRAFTSEETELRKLDGRFFEYLRARVRHRLVGFGAGVGGMVVWMLATTAILVYGGRMVFAGTLSVGKLIAFPQYMGRLLGPATQLARMGIVVQGAMAAVDRIFEFLDETGEPGGVSPAMIMTGRGKEIPEDGRIRGDVGFEEVSFRYSPDGPTVLDNVSLTARTGQLVAIVGASGAGKSTLMNLIPRFFDAVSGDVFIDGRNVKDIDVRELRSACAVVGQETFLFARSLGENIRIGRPGASDEEVREAARAALALDFIDALPDGMETTVGERGYSLSGGQRQRIAIARALLRDPKILILDEATNALDAESERKVHAALDVIMRGRTTFVIAHRLSTVSNADLILVLESGRVVESGSHEGLMARGETYARLCRSQLIQG